MTNSKTYNTNEVKNLLLKYKKDVYKHLNIMTSGFGSTFHKDWVNEHIDSAPDELLVIVLNKRQYNTIIKWRKSKNFQEFPLGSMKFPLYVSTGFKLTHTTVGYEHIYHTNAKLINFNQFLKFTKNENNET